MRAYAVLCVLFAQEVVVAILYNCKTKMQREDEESMHCAKPRSTVVCSAEFHFLFSPVLGAGSFCIALCGNP